MRSVILVAVFFATAAGLHAQVQLAGVKPLPIDTEHVDVGSTLIQPDQTIPELVEVLPEAPVAKSPASPCPAGFWKPCAFLSGELYARDRFHLTEYDRSWTKAMSNPAIIASTSLLTAATIADYKITRYCIDRHLGKEANPLMGQTRAQELGLGLGLLTLSTFATAKLKSQGHGTSAVFIQWIGTVVHTYAAYHNAVACGY